METVATDAGVFHAVAFDRLEGKQLKIGDVDQRHFHAWGAALGRLHATMGTYTGPAVDARPSWRDHLEQARSYIPGDEPAVALELDRITAALEALPSGRDRYGVIHGDFELDNLRWPVGVDGQDPGASGDGALAAPGMLDFDDCSTHWYVADVAFALRDVFDAGAGVANASAVAFVRGYRTHRPIDDELLDAMPMFSRLSRLLTYTTLIRSLDLPDSSDHPDWLRALRRRLETRAAAYAASMRSCSLRRGDARCAAAQALLWAS